MCKRELVVTLLEPQDFLPETKLEAERDTYYGTSHAVSDRQANTLMHEIAGLRSEITDAMLYQPLFARSATVQKAMRGAVVALGLLHRAVEFHSEEERIIPMKELMRRKEEQKQKEDLLRQVPPAGERNHAEKRAAVIAALEDAANDDVSARELAKRLNVDSGYVSRMRRKLAGKNANPEKAAAAKKRNGVAS